MSPVKTGAEIMELVEAWHAVETELGFFEWSGVTEAEYRRFIEDDDDWEDVEPT